MEWQCDQSKDFRAALAAHSVKSKYKGSPPYAHFWDLEKTLLHEIGVSGTVLMDSLNTIFPLYRVHRPKAVVVETVLVIFM